MVLRGITALTQDKDNSLDPRVSNVILQSTQSPRAPSASQAGAFGAEGIGKDKKLLENATRLATLFNFQHALCLLAVEIQAAALEEVSTFCSQESAGFALKKTIHVENTGK